MATFYHRATPPHRQTSLRIICEAEGGRTGRYRLSAYDSERLVATSYYDWYVWHGHCCGQLLVDDFVAHAERQSAPIIQSLPQ